MQELLLLTIILLQVVTLFIIVKGSNKHGVRGSAHQPVKRAGAASADSRSGKDSAADTRRSGNAGNSRKAGDSNRGGRPQQGSGRPQGQSGQQDRNPIAAIDPMEMSLRDINRRLKSAEREQEDARKKIQDGGKEVIGRDGGNRDGFRDRPQRSDRGERSDRGPRPERAVRRDFSRSDKRPDRPDRPDRPQRDFDAATGFMQTSTIGADQQVFTPPPAVPSAPIAPPAPTIPVAPAIPVSDAGVGETDLQHGRKFTAKRRPLPSESAPSSDAPPVAEPVFTPVAEPIVTPPPQVQTNEPTGISYGR